MPGVELLADVSTQLDNPYIYVAVPGAVALGAITALLYFLKKRYPGEKEP